LHYAASPVAVEIAAYMAKTLAAADLKWTVNNKLIHQYIQKEV